MTKTRKSYLAKAVSLLLVLVMMISIIPIIEIPAYAESSGDFSYTILSDGTAKITEYNGSESDLTIPSTIDGYSVSEIANQTFWYNNSIVNVYVSDGIKIIRYDSFWRCSNLKTIYIPKSVSSIESWAFTDCTRFECFSVDYQNPNYCSVDGVLYTKDVKKLVMVPHGKGNFSIPNSVTEIDYCGFCDNVKITEIVIPDTVTVIGAQAFRECSALKTITLPSGLTETPEYCFRECTALETVYLPSGLTKLGSSTFYNCKNLKNIDLPNSLKIIGSDAFEYCISLEEIEIPNSISRIYGGAFDDCKSLRKFVIPEGIEVIMHHNSVMSSFNQTNPNTPVMAFAYGGTSELNYGLFNDCDNLRELYFPKSLTRIDKCELSSYYDQEDKKRKKTEELVLYVYSNSVAEQFAIENGYNYVLIDGGDTIKPTVSLSSTNNVASSQTVTISLSDNVGIKGYYWGTSSTYSNNSYTSTSNTSISKTVDASGTYYATAVDTSGNVSSNVSITFYKTTLNANNGSVSPTSVLTKSGNSFTFPTPTRSGYSYVGWSTSSSASSGVKTLTPSSNSTYYAVWSYTDTQNPTVSLSSTNNVASSQTVTISLSDNVGIKGYYWGTSSSYSNNSYTSTSNTSISKTVDASGTYYATAVDTSGNVSSNVSITFYKTTLNANATNASVSPTSVLTKSGNSFTFPTPTRSGYSYVGWGTSSSASSGVKSLTPSSNTTYYAVWSYNDTTKPTVSLSSTNNVASSQTVTISLSDNVGIKGYYWGTSSTYSNNSYTSTSNTSISKTVDASGTYYATAVDTSGNVSSNVSITFYKTTLNANGGSVSPTSVLTKSGNSFAFPTPTHSNSYYSYVGWSTSSIASSGVKTLTPSSNSTYYAVWSIDTILYPMAQCTIRLAQESFYVYSGSECKPEIVVTHNGNQLVKDRDYYVDYSNNVNAGTATVNVHGKNNPYNGVGYKGDAYLNFNISPRNLEEGMVQLSADEVYYTGNAIEPSVTLIDNNRFLVKNTDFTVSYYNNVNVGTASIIIKGKGNYSSSSTVTKYFTIKKNKLVFVWGQDNWRFNNSSIGSYDVNTTVMNQMKSDFMMDDYDISQLKNKIAKLNENAFGGSCFGMTVSEIMAKQGDLQLSRYGGNDIVYSNSMTSDMKSVINFMQVLQSYGPFTQAIRQAPYYSSSYTQYDYIDRLERILEDNDTFVKISYAIQKYNRNTKKYSNYGYHAVLGYGIENCNYYSSVTKKTYDKRILIADPNYSSRTSLYENACIYYQSSTHSWIVPYWYESSSSAIRMCYWNSGNSTDTGYIRNIMGYESLTEAFDYIIDYPCPHYIAGLDIDNISQNDSAVEQVQESGNPNWDYADPNGGIARYDIDLDDSININENEELYALWNPTASYTLSYSKPSDIDYTMDYESITYIAKLQDTTYSQFKPNGSISVRGSDMTYDITMLTDDSECVTDWFALSVSGCDCDNVVFTKVSDGYKLTANNMNDISILAECSDANATRTFSTNYSSVYIYEIDKNTIGIRVDTDNNGTYETELPFDIPDNAILGDVDGDGAIMITDATFIQRKIAQIDIPFDFSNDVADVDGDGKVTLMDATYLQRWLANLKSNNDIGKPINRMQPS